MDEGFVAWAPGWLRDRRMTCWQRVEHKDPGSGAGNPLESPSVNLKPARTGKYHRANHTH
ncbi:MAG: hypothetical protein HLUCCA04_08580, partial [Oceanicaulis sp. HLUCCA04]